MAISDDWNIDFPNKIISHIDGVLSYDGGTAGQAAVGDYIYGATSGAVGKVLSLTGNAASGTYTLTNVVGKFENNEAVELLSSLGFDAVTASNGGFKVGDTIAGITSASTVVVQAIEYNLGTAGEGTIYGTAFSAVFTDNEVLSVSGGSADVADARGVGVDNDVVIDTAVANLTLAIPGTTNTNNSTIVHYDAGTVAIPEGATVEDASTGAIGIAQQVYGVTATGSVRIVNSDTTGGAWTDNNNLRADMVIAYNNQVAGQVFSAGDVVVGLTSSATGRVLADTGTELILADESGTWTTTEDLQVGGVTIADANGTNTTLVLAVINTPGGVRIEQRSSQGGIYISTASLNIVRSFNSLYTYLQDTFDELGQLDDNEPMTAQVKDQAYTLVNDWQIPDLSMRFLESGSLKDSGNNNIFANIQTLGTIADITDQGFLYNATQATPQPNFYVEQNSLVLRQDWLEGNVNILVKVKTKTDTRYIDPTVNTLGQLINSGIVTVFSREYLRTYDHFQFTNTTGGFVAVPLATADDLDNNTGQYTFSWDGGDLSNTLLAGEEITVGADTVASPLRVGIVTAQTGDATATGTVTYALKSATQFTDPNPNIIGGVSGKDFDIAGSVTNVVAGYSTNVKAMTVDRRFTGGTTSVSSYVIGETVTQTGSGATGYALEDDSGTIYVQDATGTFNGTGLLTGGISAALNTPTATATFTTVPKDIGDGGGDKNYKAVISGNITNASAQTIQVVYEWAKFLTRSESTSTEGGPGTADAGLEGRIYRTLDTTFAEKKASPYGTFAGGSMFGAQGVFIDKDTLAAADIQKISLIDNAGTTITPPNLQSLSVTSLVAGDRVAVFRSTGAASTTIFTDEFAVGTVGSGFNQSADSTIKIAEGTRSFDNTNTTIPVDVPLTGVLRILDPNDTGLYLRFTYGAVDRSAGNTYFTLDTTAIQTTPSIGDVTTSVDLTAADNVFVVFIEEQAAGTSVTNTVQYNSDQGNANLLIRVRVKGILPFQTTSTFTTTGASVGAVRTTDSIVDLP